MHFVEAFLMVASMVLLFFIAGYARRHASIAGAKTLFWLMLAANIWTFGSFMELWSTGFELQLFWRNVQQIGVFSVPILTLFFALEYARLTQFRPYAGAAAAGPAVSVILIFTNEWHGWMRSGYRLEFSETFGEILLVESTPLGAILVGYNFVLPLVALAVLWAHRRAVGTAHRPQVTLLMVSFFLTFLAAWLKMALLRDWGIHVSISTLYTPAVILLFYTLFRYRFFALTPIARDKAFNVIQQGIMVLSVDFTIADINGFARKYMTQLSGRQQDHLGAHFPTLMEGYPEVQGQIDHGDELDFNIPVELPDGSTYLRLQSYPLQEPSGELLGSVWLIQDITRQKAHELELQTMSLTDGLTGLRNRRGAHQDYVQMLHQCDAAQAPVSFLMMDIDQFKAINDTYGHSGGDEVLCNFGSLLKERLGPLGSVGRLGGEEFGVTLPNTALADAVSAAEAFRSTVATTPVLLRDGRQVSYTVSIGVTQVSPHASRFDDVLKEADTALYQAKEAARNLTMAFERDESPGRAIGTVQTGSPRPRRLPQGVE